MSLLSNEWYCVPHKPIERGFKIRNCKLSSQSSVTPLFIYLLLLLLYIITIIIVIIIYLNDSFVILVFQLKNTIFVTLMFSPDIRELKQRRRRQRERFRLAKFTMELLLSFP